MNSNTLASKTTKRTATQRRRIRQILKILSEIPDDLIQTNPPPNPRDSIGGGDSQHSTASTESTLSEIASRQSDLSSIGENSEWLAAMDPRSLDCSVIIEEEEDEHGDETADSVSPLPPARGQLKHNNSSQSIPREKMKDAKVEEDSREVRYMISWQNTLHYLS